MSAGTRRLFSASGADAVLLGEDEVATLQALLERCSDFWWLVGGEAPGPELAANVLAMLPPDQTRDDKLVIGCWSEGTLVGCADLIRGLRRADDWCLGLFVLDPAQRRRGLGRQLFGALARWMVAEGARSVCLVVQAQNTVGLAFWQALGFVEYDRSRSRVGALESDIYKLELALDGSPASGS